jgi:hypothetical protein
MTQWGLDTLFNPAKRHMDEEKRRLQSTRQEIGDASGGRRIDFESGKVKIERTAADDDEQPDGPEIEPEAKSDTPKREPTPAEIRAAQRRGRKPR